jgi:hypothetical protein
VAEGKSPPPPPLELSHSTLPVIGAPRMAPRPRPPRLSLGAKWALSLLVAAALIVGLVAFVDGHNTDYTPGYPVSAKAAAEADREASVLERQDQAPQLLRAARGAAPVTALEHAMRSVMQARIADNDAGPPLRPARCHPTVTLGGRHGFACTVLAGGVYYDFVGVLRARSITLCKRDPPPVPSETVPLDRRCFP